MSSEPQVVKASAGSRMSFMPGEVLVWKATGAVTANAYDFGEMTVEPQVGTPEHVHHGHDETFYVLEGSFRFKLGTQLVEVSEGGFVYIPRGTPHTWLSLDSRRSRTLILFTPGGMDGYFRELGPLLPELMPHLNDLSQAPPDALARADEIMRRFQYEMVGPPLT